MLLFCNISNPELLSVLRVLKANAKVTIIPAENILSMAVKMDVEIGTFRVIVGPSAAH
jgi:hypothetical protein